MQTSGHWASTKEPYITFHLPRSSKFTQPLWLPFHVSLREVHERVQFPFSSFRIVVNSFDAYYVLQRVLWRDNKTVAGLAIIEVEKSSQKKKEIWIKILFLTLSGV